MNNTIKVIYDGGIDFEVEKLPTYSQPVECDEAEFRKILIPMLRNVVTGSVEAEPDVPDEGEKLPGEVASGLISSADECQIEVLNSNTSNWIVDTTTYVENEKVRKLRELADVACSEGNYNYNEYMYGMANGMICALAVLDDKEPEYLSRPARFIEEFGHEPIEVIEPDSIENAYDRAMKAL